MNPHAPSKLTISVKKYVEIEYVPDYIIGIKGQYPKRLGYDRKRPKAKQIFLYIPRIHHPYGQAVAKSGNAILPIQRKAGYCGKNAPPIWSIVIETTAMIL